MWRPLEPQRHEAADVCARGKIHGTPDGGLRGRRGRWQHLHHGVLVVCVFRLQECPGRGSNSAEIVARQSRNQEFLRHRLSTQDQAIQMGEQALFGPHSHVTQGVDGGIKRLLPVAPQPGCLVEVLFVDVPGNWASQGGHVS